MFSESRRWQRMRWARYKPGALQPQAQHLLHESLL